MFLNALKSFQWVIWLVAEHKPDLCTIVVEDAHQADGHGLIKTVTQSFPGESKHEWHPLFTTSVDDGVESFIQASYKSWHFFWDSDQWQRQWLMQNTQLKMYKSDNTGVHLYSDLGESAKREEILLLTIV